MTANHNESDKLPNTRLPVSSAEDVEFSGELADEEDREAMERAAAADERVADHEGD